MLWLEQKHNDKLENVQKRIVKWISPIGGSYKACLDFLGILPLLMYIQVNNFLLLSKLILGKYDNEPIDMPFSAAEIKKENLGRKFLLSDKQTSNFCKN